MPQMQELTAGPRQLSGANSGYLLAFVTQNLSPLFSRDVRNRFLNFGSVSVRFLKKTRILLGMNLVRFGLQKLGSARIVIYY